MTVSLLRGPHPAGVLVIKACYFGSVLGPQCLETPILGPGGWMKILHQAKLSWDLERALQRGQKSITWPFSSSMLV